jgi:hypothetical protein
VGKRGILKEISAIVLENASGWHWRRCFGREKGRIAEKRGFNEKKSSLVVVRNLELLITNS